MLRERGERAIGEAYVFGDFDIEGDVVAAFELSDMMLGRNETVVQKARLAALLRRLPATGRPRLLSRKAHLPGAVHSKARDREAIHYHYDLPPEFYELFLGPQMVYSCAYFHSEHDSLEHAQEQKLDHICRKLRLRPGERFLDIGCGWGALVIHASKHYGAISRGITLSQPQAKIARQRARKAGVESLCSIEARDYRELDARHQFDKIASIGMFEHVGERMLPTYFHHVYDLLRNGGVFLNHGIAVSAMCPPSSSSFIDEYVFPDGELVPINKTVNIGEHAGFELRDIESLREHYAITLQQWTERLEANAAEARRLTNETTYRIWRMYMAGSAHAFRTGRLNLYQSLFVKSVGGKSNLPLTRDDWYSH
jgi:cyclopropane-fatty-acyl-phospholipid synthase